MTSKIRLRIEYLIPTENILMLFTLKFDLKSSLIDVFNTINCQLSEVVSFLLGYPVDHCSIPV